MLEESRWEDMNMDCLVNILGRLDVESLLLDVPFVCKSWYHATSDVRCWQRLVFPVISLDEPPFCNDIFDVRPSRLVATQNLKDELSVTAFIKSVVKRSDRSATSLELPKCFTNDALLYVANECPELRSLVLPDDINLGFTQTINIPKLINKWKHLEYLRLGSSYMFREILTQISRHCNNFVALAVGRAYIKEEEASDIVNLLPKIEVLDLRRAFITKESLVVLFGCKHLEYLDVRNCVGFDEDDKEILMLASSLNTVKLGGSMTYQKYYDCYGCPYSVPLCYSPLFCNNLVAKF